MTGRPRLTAGLAGMLVLLATAPAAQAQPLPGPEPGPEPGPVPGPTVTNNGVPVGSGVTIGAAGNQVESSTTNAFVDPVTNIPNINGDPCSGAWESVVCYSMQQGNMPVVQPRSTISSSP